MVIGSRRRLKHLCATWSSTKFVTIFSTLSYSAYFADRQLYGGIPILARDANTGAVGVFCSTNSGTSFTSLAGSVNTHATFIVTTNVTFFFYGSENGLYRSKDAGATWTHIKSGLANHLVINCFTQSEGPAGSPRRIWVGTTGGVFAGAKSLDLY